MTAQRTLRTQKDQEGFTIIELLTVMAMLCLLAAIGIPAVRSFSGSADIRAAVAQVRADVWLARQRAIATSEPHSLFFNVTDNTYTVFRDDGDGTAANAANGQIDSGEEVLVVRTLQNGFNLTNVNLDPTNAVILMPRGMLKTGTAGGQLTIGGAHVSRTLLIRASGQCRME
jgi:prepilin-type N-terminal cleavage/methylation domain-containing protein